MTLPTTRRSAGALATRSSNLMEEVGLTSLRGDGLISLEHEWFNFDSLNFDIDHPRQMQDTLYIDGRVRPRTVLIS